MNQKDRLAAVSPKSDQVVLLALMAQANTKLECLLAQTTHGALHLFRNFSYWRLRFRVGLQFAIFRFRSPRALRSLIVFLAM
jgi:hypothetical protein